MVDSDITANLSLDTSGLAEDFREIGDAFHAVADEIEDSGDGGDA